MALALLAVLAQLWMAQLSTRHLGQMLWQQTLWGEVCSASGSAHAMPGASSVPDFSGTSDASDASDSLSRMASCPVCSAAAAGLAPGHSSAATPAARGDTPYQRAPASAPLQALRHASLRPPAQAPPRA